MRVSGGCSPRFEGRVWFFSAGLLQPETSGGRNGSGKRLGGAARFTGGHDERLGGGAHGGPRAGGRPGPRDPGGSRPLAEPIAGTGFRPAEAEGGEGSGEVDVGSFVGFGCEAWRIQEVGRERAKVSKVVFWGEPNSELLGVLEGDGSRNFVVYPRTNGQPSGDRIVFF